jgi:L-cysteine:1D-myo-inositol 2-amino-2-deoxy-alpha-D-glucopyranoside ligase
MVRLFDTASKTFKVVQPGEPVRIYVCGITPYDSAHLGHAFTFLTYDLLRRRLEDHGASVRLARNITDVDEPIYAKARELGVDYRDLARTEAASFQEMMRWLNLKDPEAEPKPSDHIDQIAGAVKELLDAGFAYRLEGDVYFEAGRFASFGEISGYEPRLMTAFDAIRGGDPERSGKRGRQDFLLWRHVSDPDDPAAWDTAVGYGRPGWHIECSVMAREHLGGTVDVHGGGTDLVFPHHECENAQSSALGSVPFARCWAHTAPMLLGGEKMSKSLGNLIFVRDLADQFPPSVVRLALMRYHYRSGGEWRSDALAEAAADVEAIRTALTRPDGPDPAPFLARVRAALDDDLDTPAALHAIRELTASILTGGHCDRAPGGLAEILELLGVDVAHAGPGERA